MAVSVYSNGKWRSLEGTYVYSTLNGWKQVDALDTLYANGSWHRIGLQNMPSDMSSMEFDTSISFHYDENEVPSGTTYYISPEGHGSGSDWNDTASYVSFIELLSNSHGGEIFCFLEGDYEIRDTITIVPDVKFYGGFSLDDTSWQARDPFLHPTRFIPSENYNGTDPWMDAFEEMNTGGVIIDGFCVDGFYSGLKDTDEAIVRNCLFTRLIGDGHVEAMNIYNTKFSNSRFAIYGNLHGCIIDNESQDALISGDAENCTVVSKTGSVKVEGTVSSNTEDDENATSNFMAGTELHVNNMYDTLVKDSGMLVVEGDSKRNVIYHCSVSIENSSHDTIVFGDGSSDMHIVNAEDDTIVGRTGSDSYRRVMMGGSDQYHSCVRAIGNGDNSLSHEYGSFVIMDGDLYHYENGNYVRLVYDIGRIPVSKWLHVTGYSKKMESSVDSSDGRNTQIRYYGYAIGDDGNLYLLDATETGSVNVTRLVSELATDKWLHITGYSKREIRYKYDNSYEHRTVEYESRFHAYGINDGYLYDLDGPTITRIKSREQRQRNEWEDEPDVDDGVFELAWMDVSGYSHNSRHNGNEDGTDIDWTKNEYCYGICGGRLYAINGTNATRVGVSDNSNLVEGWTNVSGTSEKRNDGNDNDNRYAFGINGESLYSIGCTQEHKDFPVASLNSGETGWTEVHGSCEVDGMRECAGLGRRNDEFYYLHRFSDFNLFRFTEEVGWIEFSISFRNAIEVDLCPLEDSDTPARHKIRLLRYAGSPHVDDEYASGMEIVDLSSDTVHIKNNLRSGMEFELDDSYSNVFIESVEVMDGESLSTSGWWNVYYNDFGVRINNNIGSIMNCVFRLHLSKVNIPINYLDGNLYEDSNWHDYRRFNYQHGYDRFSFVGNSSDLNKDNVHFKDDNDFRRNELLGARNFCKSTYVDFTTSVLPANDLSTFRLSDQSLHRDDGLLSLGIDAYGRLMAGEEIIDGRGNWTSAVGQICNPVLFTYGTTRTVEIKVYYNGNSEYNDDYTHYFKYNGIIYRNSDNVTVHDQGSDVSDEYRYRCWFETGTQRLVNYETGHRAYRCTEEEINALIDNSYVSQLPSSLSGLYSWSSSDDSYHKNDSIYLKRVSSDDKFVYKLYFNNIEIVNNVSTSGMFSQINRLDTYGFLPERTSVVFGLQIQDELYRYIELRVDSYTKNYIGFGIMNNYESELYAVYTFENQIRMRRIQDSSIKGMIDSQSRSTGDLKNGNKPSNFQAISTGIRCDVNEIKKVNYKPGFWTQFVFVFARNRLYRMFMSFDNELYFAFEDMNPTINGFSSDFICSFEGNSWMTVSISQYDAGLLRKAYRLPVALNDDMIREITSLTIGTSAYNNVSFVSGVANATGNYPKFFISNEMAYSVASNGSVSRIEHDEIELDNVKFMLSDWNTHRNDDESNWMRLYNGFEYGYLCDYNSNDIGRDKIRIRNDQFNVYSVFAGCTGISNNYNVLLRAYDRLLLAVASYDPNGHGIDIKHEFSQNEQDIDIGWNGNDSIVLKGGMLKKSRNGVEHAMRTRFINCGGVFTVDADSSLFINCDTDGNLSNHSNFCTYAGCSGSVREGSYNIYWNCDGTIPPENNMQSRNVEGNLLTLSVLDFSENGITRFVDTGMSPSQGRVVATECPNPKYNRQGYEEWIGLFGDFRLQSDSNVLNEHYAVNTGAIGDENSRDIDGNDRSYGANAGAYNGGVEDE